MESNPKPPKPGFREGMANLFAFPRRNTQADQKKFIVAVLLWGPLFAVLAAIVASAFTVELNVMAIYAAAGFISFVMAEGLASYFTMSFFGVN